MTPELRLMERPCAHRAKPGLTAPYPGCRTRPTALTAGTGRWRRKRILPALGLGEGSPGRTHSTPRGDRRQPPLRGEVASGSGEPSVRPPLCSQRCSGLGPGHPQAPGVPTRTQGHRKEEDGVPAGESAGPSAREKCSGDVLVILSHCHRARGARGSGGEARER